MTVAIRANSSGLTKASHVESRNALRISVLIESVIGSSRFGRRTVWMLDVSTLGCRIESGLAVPIGTHLVLTIPGLSPLGCEVRWLRNDTVGLRFATPLHPLVVDRITEQSVAE